MFTTYDYSYQTPVVKEVDSVRHVLGRKRHAEVPLHKQVRNEKCQRYMNLLLGTDAKKVEIVDYSSIVRVKKDPNEESSNHFDVFVTHRRHFHYYDPNEGDQKKNIDVKQHEMAAEEKQQVEEVCNALEISVEGNAATQPAVQDAKSPYPEPQNPVAKAFRRRWEKIIRANQGP